MESLMKELEGMMKQDGKELISNDNPICLVFFMQKYSKCFTAFHTLCRIEFSDTSNWLLLPKV